MMFDVMWWIVDDFIVDYLICKERLFESQIRKPILRRTTFGLANLKISIAAERTIDKSPSVSAFHVFKAIKANASGTNTVVLNFNPSKNGIITFLTNPRPVKIRIFFVVELSTLFYNSVYLPPGLQIMTFRWFGTNHSFQWYLVRMTLLNHQL